MSYSELFQRKIARKIPGGMPEGIWREITDGISRGLSEGTHAKTPGNSSRGILGWFFIQFLKRISSPGEDF